MKYTVDKEKRPIYLQIYKQIRDDIISENYPFNTKLPSKRNLAEETGISTITIEHAYALLCEEGYVEARERSGYMVIPKHLVEAFNEKLGFYSCTVPTFMQFVLTELINNGDFERHINRVRRKKRKEINETTD